MISPRKVSFDVLVDVDIPCRRVISGGDGFDQFPAAVG